MRLRFPSVCRCYSDTAQVFLFNETRHSGGVRVRACLGIVVLGLIGIAACTTSTSPSTAFAAADGTYPYTLSLSPLDMCTYRTRTSAFTFEGNLTVAGNHWRFV